MERKFFDILIPNTKQLKIPPLFLQAVSTFFNNATGEKVVPAIDSLRKAKKDLHPEFFVLEEGDMAYCRINEILKHQINRILNMDPEVSAMVEHLKQANGNNNLQLSGTYKVGLDGTGTPTVQQGGKMIGADGTVISSVMVMQTITATVNGKEEVLWTNPLMNSPAAVIPIKLWYKKETTGKKITI